MNSLIAALLCVEILQAVKRGVVTAEVLFDAIDNHAKLFRAAYGADYVRPKHHWALHLPGLLRKWGTLLTTLTQERKHRMVRRYTMGHRSLKNFEVGVMQEITCHALHKFRKDLPIAGLLTPCPPKRMVALALQEMFPGANPCNILVSPHARCTDGSVHAGDVVRIAELAGNDFKIGKLLCNTSIDGAMFAIVSTWRAMKCSPAGADPRMCRMHVQDNVEVIPASQVQCALPYNMDITCKFCVVYIPWHHRAR